MISRHARSLGVDPSAAAQPNATSTTLINSVTSSPPVAAPGLTHLAGDVGRSFLNVGKSSYVFAGALGIDFEILKIRVYN
jgi:hypothetical protein